MDLHICTWQIAVQFLLAANQAAINANLQTGLFSNTFFFSLFKLSPFFYTIRSFLYLLFSEGSFDSLKVFPSPTFQRKKVTWFLGLLVLLLRFFSFSHNLSLSLYICVSVFFLFGRWRWMVQWGLFVSSENV